MSESIDEINRKTSETQTTLSDLSLCVGFILDADDEHESYIHDNLISGIARCQKHLDSISEYVQKEDQKNENLTERTDFLEMASHVLARRQIDRCSRKTITQIIANPPHPN